MIGLIADYTGLANFIRENQYQEMTDDFRIAVAGFATQGADPSLGEELAAGAYLRIEDNIDELDLDYTVSVWGPNRVGTIGGDARAERAQSAEELAQRHGADLVVYGTIDARDSIWSVTPEFYLADERTGDTSEVSGQHEMGEPFTVTGEGNTATRAELSQQMASRSELLSRIAVGLAYYTAHNYEEALDHFRAIESHQLWEVIGGQEVLFILIGNAAGRADAVAAAADAYQQALAIDLEYSRALAGLASVYYLQALQPFQESKEPSDTDQGLLQRSIDTYLLALEAERQAPLADISSKVNFGLGQDYFMQAYTQGDGSFDLAIKHFQAVIDNYDDGENPRTKQLAAEAHARLGLIYVEAGRPDLAVQEYEAAAILSDDPDRRKIFEERVQELGTDTGTAISRVSLIKFLTSKSRASPSNPARIHLVLGSTSPSNSDAG